ncbi:NADH dehydrogenase [ubiquinone] 1 beta subcomplex subunit 4 [Notechis scutatus]|uniref:NADH dehydrogenase [ubiquinone] 1 beta subcomplex subunit 4 n=1 Tax=Notechis scutatus TaxID=8663 RepID=A0A6J1ULM9_9SAUR|nr:NADH dehydrogenase [ubiquinone] 1 beta subcomplex subunit 4 [Notechis scutatus]
MVVSSVSRFASRYRPTPLASLPPQLDPNEYQWSSEKRRAEAERVALRSRLKRDYFLRLNDPRRTELLEDTAVLRWDYARRQNVYSSHRFSPKSSLLSLLWGAGPFVFWYYILKSSRAYKERLKSEGRYDEGFRTSY